MSSQLLRLPYTDLQLDLNMSGGIKGSLLVLLVLVRTHPTCKSQISAGRSIAGLDSSQSANKPGLGCGPADQGQEPRGRLHHHGEGGRDLADAEVHHVQSHPAAGSSGECQCTGGQPGQEVGGDGDVGRC